MKAPGTFQLPKGIRAIFGGLVMLFVLALVLSWIGDFREAQRGGEGTSGTTEASNDTSPPANSGELPTDDSSNGGRTLTVIVDGLNLRAGPERGTRSLKVLSAGTELKILQKNGSWYRVEHPDGVTGYVMGSDEYVKID